MLIFLYKIRIAGASYAGAGSSEADPAGSTTGFNRKEIILWKGC